MFSSALKLVRLGFEYKDALQSALDKANSGAPASDVIRTFAENTETELDDKAVDALIQFVQDLQEKLPEIEKSKDELLEAFQTYWPPFRVSAHQFLESAEQGIPRILSVLRNLLEGAEARVEDIEGLFATADVALQLLEEQLISLTEVEEEPNGIS